MITRTAMRLSANAEVGSESRLHLDSSFGRSPSVLHCSHGTSFQWLMRRAHDFSTLLSLVGIGLYLLQLQGLWKYVCLDWVRFTVIQSMDQILTNLQNVCSVHQTYFTRVWSTAGCVSHAWQRALTDKRSVSIYTIFVLEQLNESGKCELISVTIAAVRRSLFLMSNSCTIVHTS